MLHKLYVLSGWAYRGLCSIMKFRTVPLWIRGRPKGLMMQDYHNFRRRNHEGHIEPPPHLWQLDTIPLGAMKSATLNLALFQV